MFGKDLHVKRYGFLRWVGEIIDPLPSVYPESNRVTGIHCGKACPLDCLDKFLKEIAIFYTFPTRSHPWDNNSDRDRDYQQYCHHLDQGESPGTAFEMFKI
jgi:hypothetical protein